MRLFLAGFPSAPSFYGEVLEAPCLVPTQKSSKFNESPHRSVRLFLSMQPSRCADQDPAVFLTTTKDVTNRSLFLLTVNLLFFMSAGLLLFIYLVLFLLLSLGVISPAKDVPFFFPIPFPTDSWSPPPPLWCFFTSHDPLFIQSPVPFQTLLPGSAPYLNPSSLDIFCIRLLFGAFRNRSLPSPLVRKDTSCFWPCTTTLLSRPTSCFRTTYPMPCIPDFILISCYTFLSSF